MPIEFTIIPTPQDDAVQMGAPGEESTWTRTFKAVAKGITIDEETGEPTYVPRVWDVLDADGVPVRGERSCSAGTYSPVEKVFVCQSVDASPDPASPYAWNIRARYTARTSWPAEGEPWFKITTSTGFRTTGIYRDGDVWGSVPSDGSVAYPPTSWIGGTKLDLNLNPISWKIVQQQIQIDILWDRCIDNADGIVPGGSAAGPDPPPEWSTNYCNKRNDATFMGWPAGFVTYLGFTTSPIDTSGRTIVSHRFLADLWSHLEQRVVPNIGNLPLSSVSTFNGIDVHHADKVFWYQPYQTTADFSDLFTWRDALWERINEPHPLDCA